MVVMTLGVATPNRFGAGSLDMSCPPHECSTRMLRIWGRECTPKKHRIIGASIFVHTVVRTKMYRNGTSVLQCTWGGGVAFSSTPDEYGHRCYCSAMVGRVPTIQRISGHPRWVSRISPTGTIILRLGSATNASMLTGYSAPRQHSPYEAIFQVQVIRANLGEAAMAEREVTRKRWSLSGTVGQPLAS